MNPVKFNGKTIDLDAARMLMDDEICESIHLIVDTEHEFMDAYAKAHAAKFGEKFAFN